MYQLILLAAGNSTRSKLGYNKVLYTLDDKPLIYKTAKNFINDDRCNKIFLVCKESESETFKEIFKDVDKIEYVIGGDTRQQSVSNALKIIEDTFLDLDEVKSIVAFYSENSIRCSKKVQLQSCCFIRFDDNYSPCNARNRFPIARIR